MPVLLRVSVYDFLRELFGFLARGIFGDIYIIFYHKVGGIAIRFGGLRRRIDKKVFLDYNV